MAEYIEREAAIKCCTFGRTSLGLVDELRRLPAADVWEVVHCADCAHAEESLVNGCVYCNEMERARIKEGFCAWGEKREES